MANLSLEERLSEQVHQISTTLEQIAQTFDAKQKKDLELGRLLKKLHKRCLGVEKDLAEHTINVGKTQKLKQEIEAVLAAIDKKPIVQEYVALFWRQILELKGFLTAFELHARAEKEWKKVEKTGKSRFNPFQ